MEHKILMQSSAKELSTMIMNHLDAGWELSGGLFHIGNVLYQVVVKNASPKLVEPAKPVVKPVPVKAAPQKHGDLQAKKKK